MGVSPLRLTKRASTPDAGHLRAGYGRETVRHELLHWVHMGDPSGTYRARIKGHFAKRIKGEQLRTRGATKYYEDEWYDFYAGAVYGFEGKAPGGLEIPTRYLQLHANPDAMAKVFNELSTRQRAKFLETHAEAMRIFYEPAPKK